MSQAQPRRPTSDASNDFPRVKARFFTLFPSPHPHPSSLPRPRTHTSHPQHSLHQDEVPSLPRNNCRTPLGRTYFHGSGIYFQPSLHVFVCYSCVQVTIVLRQEADRSDVCSCHVSSLFIATYAIPLIL